MGDAGAGAAVEDADAVADFEGFARVDFLDDGDAVSAVEFDGDFEAGFGLDVLSDVGSGDGSEGRSADGGGGVSGAAADLVAEESARDAAEDGAADAAAFDGDVPDGGDAAPVHGLGVPASERE